MEGGREGGREERSITMCFNKMLNTFQPAAVAQLGERQTEDLKVPGSIPGLGIFSHYFLHILSVSNRKNILLLFSCTMKNLSVEAFFLKMARPASHRIE